jgi:hypothetical protein
MSKTGVSLSPGPDNGEVAVAPTVDLEVARVPALTGSSCDTSGNPKKKSAPPDAASATRHGTTILTVDAVLNMTRQLPGFTYFAPNGHDIKHFLSPCEPVHAAFPVTQSASAIRGGCRGLSRRRVADGAMADLVELAKFLDVGSPGRLPPIRCDGSAGMRLTRTGETPSSQAILHVLLATLDGGAGDRH